MITVAVTGSKGFVGSALTKRLKKLDIKVIEVDLVFGYDITNSNSLSNIGNFDFLIHLAAKSFVPDSYEDPLSFYKTNIIGTLNVLELCRKNKAKIIFTSSYVYGVPEYLPIDENHPLKAFNPYAQSKLIGEDLCRAYERDFEISYTIFRPFNIYGPHQNINFLLPKIFSQAKTGQIKLKDPRPRRDYIYIDDVVDAYIKAIELNSDKSEIFNLGFGQSYSVEYITRIIQSLSDEKIIIQFTNEYRKNEILNTVSDISLTKKLLDWRPKISLDEGVFNIFKNNL